MLFVHSLLLLSLIPDLVIELAVSELGADQFSRRERATWLLQRVGLSAYQHLMRGARSSDQEIRRRAEGLLKPIQLKALTRAAERQVILKGGKEEYERCLGTVMNSDSHKAYILTTIQVTTSCKDHAEVEWGGSHYPACLERYDDDLGLAMYSIPFNRRISPIPLALGYTKGYWWNHHTVLNGVFKRNMELEGTEDEDRGAGIFTLDESSPRLMLAGVYGGLRLGTARGWWPLPGLLLKDMICKLHSKRVELPYYSSVPDAKTIQMFLEKQTSKSQNARSK